MSSTSVARLTWRVPSIGFAVIVLAGLLAISRGEAVQLGGRAASSQSTGIAVAAVGLPTGGGWSVSASGEVTPFNSAPSYGDARNLVLAERMVGIASTPTGGGYWLVASDGGIFAFGDVGFYGSTGGWTLNRPIVGMAETPDGRGYWMVASDGGIFAFGDAGYFGSTGSLALNKPIVGMASTPDGKGYWLVASDGGVFAFGDANFFGSMGNIALARPIVAMASTPDGRGYWMVGSDGGVFALGDAAFRGSVSPQPDHPAVAVVPFGTGYDVVSADGVWHGFGPAPSGSPVATTTIPTPPVTTVPPHTVPSTAFTAFVGSANPALLKGLSTQLGYSITYGFGGMGQTTWSSIEAITGGIVAWKGSGYHMIWAIPMLPSSGGVSLSIGATGAYNGYFTTLAQNLVAAGMGNSYLRLGWEFNQTGFPWYAAGQSAAFVAYWQQIVTAMRSVPGAQFTFVWNPSRGDNGSKDLAMGNLANYYPGDAYVDTVGMDVYDTAWNTYPGEAAEFQSTLTRTWGLNWLASFGSAHKKPLAIPELGLGPFGPSAGNGMPFTGSGIIGGGDDPAFINDMFNWIGHNNVSIVGYWDTQESTIENGQNPLTAAALRKALTGTNFS